MRELVNIMPFSEAVEKDAAFNALVLRQSRFVFRVAFSVLRNVQDSEDVVQETFLRIHRRGTQLQMDNERAFLATTAWRLAADRRRRQKLDVEVTELPSGAPGPEREVLALALSISLERLIDGLPETLRQPLVLSGIDEMTSREIGVLMGIPEGTVRSRIMRARQLLRERLGYE
ncbi:MAG: polymerase, sigma-24 subunit, subfamily [Bryobacterales bacterium]|jgi:RNA polymerase sigma-70 factor (ECF subfamily)|nr:polymerase, sigma-24 subunit, subfamily [Bryobacterales bacterium]